MNKKIFFNDGTAARVNPNMKVHPNPCPEKMARAVEFIEKNGLPPEVKRVKKTKKQEKSTPSTLQNELLTVYNFEPTEQQMQQLKAFLAQLFADTAQETTEQMKEKVAA